MKLLFPLLLILTYLLSCQPEPEPSSCGVTDPINELEWLRVKTDKIIKYQEQYCDTICCASGVWQASLQQETVFVFGVNNDANLGNIVCDGAYPVYNCKGDSLGLLGILEVQDRRLIWSSR